MPFYVAYALLLDIPYWPTFRFCHLANSVGFLREKYQLQKTLRKLKRQITVYTGCNFGGKGIK